MTTKGRRQGFSLVELLVAMVVAGLVLGATYQVLVTNQRVHTTQQEQMQAQGTVRAGLAVLSSELRAISPSGGDIEEMSEERLEIRVPRATGFVCGAAGTDDERDFTLRLTGRQFVGGEDVVVLAHDYEAGTHHWLGEDDPIRVQSAGEPGPPDVCGWGESEQEVRVQGSILGEIVGDTREVLGGHPIHMLEISEYGLQEHEDEYYLGRDGEPLVGPVRRDGGVRFEYFAADGSEADVPGEVARIRVTVVAESGATMSDGQPVGDSLSVTVHPRN